MTRLDDTAETLSAQSTAVLTNGREAPGCAGQQEAACVVCASYTGDLYFASCNASVHNSTEHTLFISCGTHNSTEHTLFISCGTHNSTEHTLFISCERSASQRTDRPVGMWRTRTADSVLLTCCPPAPPALMVVISKSLSGTSMLFTWSPTRNYTPFDRCWCRYQRRRPWEHESSLIQG